MATSTFVHSDDDGVVSIFISGTGADSEILFVCEHRHWWSVNPAEGGSATKAETKRALEGASGEKPRVDIDKSLAVLGDKFGPNVYKAMRIE